MNAAHYALRAVGRQAWLPGRGRLLRGLAPPARLSGRTFEVDAYGHRFSGDASSLIDWSVFFLGAYAPEELELLSDLAAIFRRERGSVNFYDVGANVGNHTLYMASRVDRVIAFEPHPGNHARLKRHLTANGLSNVRALDCALGSEAGEAEIAVYDGANHGAASIVRTGGHPIKVVRGDDLVASAALPRMDLLKIDVEGYEANVIAGLRASLLRDRPAVLMELLGPQLSGFSTVAALRAAIYPDHSLYSLKRRRGGFGKAYRLAPYAGEQGEVLCLPTEIAL